MYPRVTVTKKMKLVLLHLINNEISNHGDLSYEENARTYARTHARTRTYAHTHRHTRTHTQAHTHASIHTQAHTHAHMHAHTRTHACTYTHTHKYGNYFIFTGVNSALLNILWYEPTPTLKPIYSHCPV